MFKRFNKIIFLLFVFSIFATWVLAAPSPDAIGVRVAPNPKHYSALKWYQSQGFKGSPQALVVDGYEAIRDGRTVYVNAANVVEVAPIGNDLTVGDQFYTNIFIISYNQDAEKATEDIFGQLVVNWKFNNNILKTGACLDEASKFCVYTSSCKAGDFCISSHDVSVRDTRRLADLSDMNELLAAYRSRNQGLCPKLESGSYLPNKSLSTWPSWQEALGKALGANLPFDPINRMGPCAGFNDKTCWNELTRKYAATSTLTSISLPAGSLGYSYYSTPDGKSCGFSIITESGLSCNATGVCTVGANVTVNLNFNSEPNHLPIITCGQMIGLPHTPFSRFVSANDPDPGDNNSLTWSIDTSGTAWTNWSAPPVLRKTTVINQQEVFATQSGNKGSYSFKVTATDSTGSSTTKVCAIGLGATLPVIMPIPNQIVYSGEQMSAFTVYASEPEKDYALAFTFNATNLTTGATVNNIFTCASVSPVFGEPNGRFNCNLSQQAINHPAGDYEITVGAADKTGDATSVTYIMRVLNNPPAFTFPSVTWEASTTIPINQILWEANDLLSNFPLTFTNLPAMLNGLAPSTATVMRPNVNVPFTYGTTVTNSSVGVRALQYSVNGTLSNTNTFAAAITNVNFTAGATDLFGLNATNPYTVRVTNIAPVVGAISCITSVRHSSPYSCTIPVSDANANAIAGHTGFGLPGGLSSSLAGNTITISGTPVIGSAGVNNISVNARDEFGFTGANATYALTVRTFCGDNVLQNPNLEGVAETCDGPVGGAGSPAVSDSTNQYCTTANCTKSGGWCGDGNINFGNGEVCDDGNRNNIDGCDANCNLEANWTCAGNPSVCSPNVQTVACVGASANSVPNVSPTVLQTWTGVTWSPSNNATYDTSPGICRYVCQPCFHWNGASCVADFCGDGLCSNSCGETYANCSVDSCVPTCSDPTTTLVFSAAHSAWYCAKNAYTWTEQLDHRCNVHFHSNGTITYSNETSHGILSVAYGYPTTFSAATMFPAVAGTFYDLNVSGSSCFLAAAATVAANEIIIPILEPSGGEHTCSAIVQQNIPAQ